MTPSRRRWVLGGGAMLAGGAGAGIAWWRERQASAATDPADAAVWALRLDAPEGPPVELAALRGRPLLINFWATWCPPCVREMPALARFHRDFAPRGWQVLGIAADKAEPVREFLRRTPVGFPIGLAGFAGIELSRQLGNEGGGLPFTVVFDRRGRIAHRHSGETHYEQLAAWGQAIF